jgi:hypothetical protein
MKHANIYVIVNYIYIIYSLDSCSRPIDGVFPVPICPPGVYIGVTCLLPEKLRRQARTTPLRIHGRRRPIGAATTTNMSFGPGLLYPSVQTGWVGG